MNGAEEFPLLPDLKLHSYGDKRLHIPPGSGDHDADVEGLAHAVIECLVLRPGPHVGILFIKLVVLGQVMVVKVDSVVVCNCRPSRQPLEDLRLGSKTNAS